MLPVTNDAREIRPRRSSRSSRAQLVLAALTALLLCRPAHASLGDELGKLTPNDGTPNDEFGWSVAVDGNTALVGAGGDSDNGIYSGSAYLVHTLTGNQLAKLTPIDGAAGDIFGYSVSVSANIGIVGAAGDDDDAGSAYLFDISSGLQQYRLTANDREVDDYFGWSVGISGNRAIVGSRWDDDNGDASGSAYLFNATTGVQRAKLTPADGAAADEFGWSVGISGNTAIVGAPSDNDNGPISGSAYLFDVETGSQLAKLKPSDGAAGDGFGISVAIDGNTAVIGAYWDGDNGFHSGSAYVFDVATGSQLAKLLPDDGAAGDWFGHAVDISGNIAVVGANRADDNAGSAYLFDVTTGAQLAKLVRTDAAAGDAFGWSAAVSGNSVIVGAYGDDTNGDRSGSVYLFDATIPEPGALLMGSLATLGMFAFRAK